MQPITLFCLPNAGASASIYAGWRRLAPSVLHIVPLELPGRGVRGAEPLLDTFDALRADAERQLLQRLSRHQPYALFGHSMGALLAHALAQRLRETPPVALFVAGAAAPALRDPARFSGPLDDAALLAQMRELGGTPPELLEHAEMMALALPIMRADFRACASYRHDDAARLRCAVHAYGGHSDRSVGRAIEGWRDVSTGPNSVTWYDGGHFFVRDAAPDMLQRMAAHLARDLATC